MVFFDDILVYSKTWDDHVAHLDTVLDILDRASLYAKESKCALGMSVLLYLGHIINAEGVRMDPSKVLLLAYTRQPDIVEKDDWTLCILPKICDRIL